MKNLFYSLAVLLFSAALVHSCHKDLPNEDEASALAGGGVHPVVFNVSDHDLTFRNDGPAGTRTVLGRLRQNPYTVANMTTARNNISVSPSAQPLRPTDLYVKFNPANDEDIAELAELDVHLSDFPLEYEVIEMGDYYYESTGPNDYPDYYAVMKTFADFPSVPYEILAELHLDETNLDVVREAFRITGNEAEIPLHFPPDLVGSGPSFNPSDCHEGCPGWPCCTTGLIGCDDDVILSECQDFTPTCHPGLANYPSCLNNPGGGSSPMITNSCGCQVFANYRKPGGCIKVEDTQLGLEGVRRVQVRGWNGWFTFDYTSTDDNGCWRINREYAGKSWFWVKFKSDRAKIRGGANNLRLWERLLPIQDYVGVVNGPFFNNISINYNMWTEQNSQAHRFWGAASTNNALHEFHDNAANDGIFPPPSNLDLYISTGSASGFALMTRFLDPDDIATLSFNSITSATSIWGNFTTIAAIGSAVSTSVLRLVLPDVMIGADFVTSDRHRALAFHELAHASHFVRAGAPFWTDLAVAEIQADFAVGHPWGLSTSPEAGRIALCESWAEHIGGTYAHRKYGANMSINDPWEVRLERTRNFRPNHIPIGIYHDLADTGTEPLSRDVLGGGGGVVADAVSGFTIAQMYGLFTPVMVSPTQYRDALIAGPLSSTSNTAAQVLNLFGSY